MNAVFFQTTKEEEEPQYMVKNEMKIQDFEEWEKRLPTKMASRPDDPAELMH